VKHSIVKKYEKLATKNFDGLNTFYKHDTAEKYRKPASHPQAAW
jgi:hypothetical protein